jgi:hypothetical protein
MSFVVMMLIMAGVPGYFFIQPAALRTWSGGWRKAAWAPMALVILSLPISLWALGQGSSLWPLSFVFSALIGSAYLGILWLIQWLFF